MLVEAFQNSDLGSAHDRSLNLLPDSTHSGDEGLGSIPVIEVELDYHDVGIIDRTVNTITANSRCLPIRWIAYKCSPPFLVLRDRMFDLHGQHGFFSRHMSGATLL
jgi:hypothetical protein